MLRVRGVAFLGDEMFLALEQGGILTFAVAQIPSLWVIPQRERCQVKIVRDGEALEWPNLGELWEVEQLAKTPSR